VEHPLAGISVFTASPTDFIGFLWKYRTTISETGVLEDYRTIVAAERPPGYVVLRYAYTVYHDWNTQGYTVTFDE
jgi:hypothetical protein